MRLLSVLVGVVLVTTAAIGSRGDEIQSTARSEAAAQNDDAGAASQRHADGTVNLRVNRTIETALPVYRRKVELEPINSDARVHLGMALVGVGQSDEGINQLREAIRLAPDNAEAHSSLGIVLLTRGQSDKAIRELSSAVKLKPDHPKYLRSLAFGLATVGRIDESIDALRNAIRLDPSDFQAHAEIGISYLNLGQFSAAIYELSKSLSIKDDARARLARAVAQCRNGDFAASVLDCDILIQQDAKNHAAYACRAFAKMRLGEFAAATLDAERAIDTGDEYVDKAYIVLGAVSWVRKDKVSAIEHLNMAISLRPDHPLAFTIRAAVRFDDGSYDEAFGDLNTAISLAESPAELNYLLDGYGWQVYKFRSLLQLRRSSLEGAAKDITEAIQLNQVDPDCFALCGWISWMLADWKQAHDDLNRALTIDPNHPLAGVLLMNLLTSCPDNRYRDARRALELATDFCKKAQWKNPEFLVCLAAAYSENADFESAISTQSEAVKQLRQSRQRTRYGMKVLWNSEIYVNVTTKQEDAAKRLSLYRDQKPIRLQLRNSKDTMKYIELTPSDG
jgi:tetratricopeptide (TPR) repeat protein